MSLDSPLVVDFKMKRQGHTTKQAEVLPVTTLWRPRYKTDCVDVRGTFASMVLLMARGCVRFKRIQRSDFVGVTEEFLVLRCHMGKRRQQGAREGFRWATPRRWAPGHDTTAAALNLIMEMSSEAKDYAGAPSCRQTWPRPKVLRSNGSR